MLTTPLGLALKWRHLTITVDFASKKSIYRHHFGGNTKPLLAKAIGISRCDKPTVIDATAGLGRDSFVIASLGCQILMLERCHLLIALLKDGIKRALANPTLATIGKRMSLIATDSITFLSKRSDCEKPQVIYLDPMFPPRSKSALVKKEMQVLQALLGSDKDATLLLEAALACATRQVVVKRPKWATSLTTTKPDATLMGKTIRFDIYWCHKK